MTTNRHKTFLYRDIAGCIGLFLTLILLYFYVCEFLLNDSSFSIFPVIFIGIAVILDFILRKYTKNLVIYLILHLLPIALLFIPGLPLYGCIILALEYAYVYYNSVIYWKNDGLDKHSHTIILPTETVLFYILIFLHSFYGLSNELTRYVYISGFIFFILSLLIKYFDKIMLETLTAEGNKRTLPTNAYSLNSTLVALFIGFIILTALGIAITLSDTSFNFIGTILKYIGSFIVYLLTLLPKWKEDSSSTTEASGKENLSSGGPGYIEASENPIANAIFIVIQIFIYILIIAGIIYLVYSFFKQYMYRTKKEEDIIESTTAKDTISKTPRTTSAFRKFFSSMSVNERIRKIYYKKVTDLRKQNLTVKKSNTADEISAAAKSQTNTSIDELTDIYQKARYGCNELTKDDLARCKV